MACTLKSAPTMLQQPGKLNFRGTIDWISVNYLGRQQGFQGWDEIVRADESILQITAPFIRFDNKYLSDG
jgi:hypothetical protein